MSPTDPIKSKIVQVKKSLATKPPAWPTNTAEHLVTFACLRSCSGCNFNSSGRSAVE